MLLVYYSYIDLHLGLYMFVKDQNVARDHIKGKGNILVWGP